MANTQRGKSSGADNPPFIDRLADPTPAIGLSGVAQNNLTGFDLAIPLDKLTVISGVSGSGKSSLAFDTLYAEGQKRYVETFSPYIRQFLERLPRPEVSGIDRIPAAIAIQPSGGIKGSRSTVGSLTAINDYLKLLFAKAADPWCIHCDKPVVQETAAHAAEAIRAVPGMVLVAAPVDLGGFDEPAVVLRVLKARGFTRFLRDGQVVKLSALSDADVKQPVLRVVVDRVNGRKATMGRCLESIETAFAMAGDRLELVLPNGDVRVFSRKIVCGGCGFAVPSVTPAFFSFNSPLGACPECHGFGRVIDIDPLKVIPDPSLTLKQGAIKPLSTVRGRRWKTRMKQFCQDQGIPWDVPFQALPAEQVAMLLDGGPGFSGVRGFFKKLERKKYKMHVRVFIARFRGYETCPTCGGSRLGEQAMAWRLAGRTVADIWNMPVVEANHLFKARRDDPDPSVRLLTREIASRLGYLCDVGLGYLCLSRQSRTLSGGELERVNLTTALGTRLVGALFVLDEPSIGLHPVDGERLLGILKKIRDQGNTVVVVEHDPLILRNADRLIDLGPNAGRHGGRLLAAGTPAEVCRCDASRTAAYLTGKEKIPVPCRRTLTDRPAITIKGATCHNLKSVDCRIPIGVMTCITGPSGSGKSSLLVDTLWRHHRLLSGDPDGTPGDFTAMAGLSHVNGIVLVDQAPPGKSTRASPASYLKLLDPIRKVFAKTKTAQARGYAAGRFSFNSKLGQCPECGGDGFQRVEMQFLPDVFVPCEDCGGSRYAAEVLDVRHCGHTIADVMGMTIEEASDLFGEARGFRKTADTVMRLGLGYLRLGQPLTQLSAGEAQRLKLIRHLMASGRERLLFILDEPSVGLHLADISALLTLLSRLVAAGHTVCVIEHNMEIVKCADYCIDLGPGGGEEGGVIMAAGPPETVAKSRTSLTAPFLRQALDGQGLSVPAGGNAAEAASRKRLSRGIDISGAREHNLKDIDVSIPRQKMTVVTGLSGAGKSTLVYDVVFSEGQRRYLDCLSPYARQFAENLTRPDVDHIEGIPPTVAIEQRTSAGGARSTVGTVTEIYPFLRLLYARIGVQYCPDCDRPVRPRGEAAIVRAVERVRGSGGWLLVPQVRGRRGFHQQVLLTGLKAGYEVARINGKLVALTPELQLSRYKTYDIDLAACRLEKGIRHLREKVSEALALGEGTVIYLAPDGKESVFSRKRACPDCERGFESPEPRNFSFRSKWGMCNACEGQGASDGGPCAECGGARLASPWRHVRLGKWQLGDLARLEVDQLPAALDGLKLSKRDGLVATPILKEAAHRIRFLKQVGLGYLTLHRAVTTLSTGEARRIRLAAQLGSNLHGVCYLLDEPTIGLHPRDNDKLLEALGVLRDRGNTIVVVEHDEATIRAADHVIELGPGPGVQGGEVVFTGTPEGLACAAETATGRWFADGACRLADEAALNGKAVMTLRGATVNNLKQVTARFPLGALIAVTGVSGAGKSSLVSDALVPGLESFIETGRGSGPFEALDLSVPVKRVLAVDQSPIGRTPKSVPATYVGLMSTLRNIFANLPEAKLRGFTSRHFSFNTPDGACEQCKGQGRIRVVMNFLPDVFVPCEACLGLRYKPDVLLVKLDGRSIGDVLQMPMSEAAEFFVGYAKVARPLRFLVDIGLGYLALGQASTTLSGGEAQRIKLARELAQAGTGGTFYVLDEPTTGLHMADVGRLMGILRRIRDRGDTVCVIEHNLEVIAGCDYCIELGPEGGEGGGQILYQGPVPGMLKETSRSHTARYLAHALQLSRP